MEGGIVNEAKWEARVKELEEKVKIAEEKSTEKNVEIQEKVVTQTKVVREKGRDIIQNIDRKLPLNDIASAKGLTMEALVTEMEQIVNSGTKLNIKYWVDEMLDDDQQEEIHDYFMESHSDNIEEALKEFDGDYDIDELRLMRIKFISEVAN